MKESEIKERAKRLIDGGFKIKIFGEELTADSLTKVLSDGQKVIQRGGGLKMPKVSKKKDDKKLKMYEDAVALAGVPRELGKVRKIMHENPGLDAIAAIGKLPLEEREEAIRVFAKWCLER